jgi:putative transposase
MARRKRLWETGTVYSGTIRTTNRLFLLKPTPESREIIGSSIGRALAKHPVRLHWFDTNINHTHFAFSLLPSQLNEASKFLQQSSSLISKGLNRLHHIEGGPLWSSRARVRPVLDDDAVISQMLYSATNVVKDGLVESASHWPGFSSFRHLAHGQDLRFSYIDWTAWWNAGGARKKLSPQKFVKHTKFALAPIPAWEHLSKDKRQSLYRRAVREYETKLLQDAASSGRPVLGLSKLVAVSPFDRPSQSKPRTIAPLCHASSTEMRRAFEARWKNLMAAYCDASARYLSGELDTEFPGGMFRPPLVTIYDASAL